MNREFLMLAQTYKKQRVNGWTYSEKLDGMRAWWDGGVTRGLECSKIPWANNDKKKEDKKSTGLWSRLGNPIFAPDWWVDRIPKFSLDGELWMGRGMFEKTMSICKRQDFSGDWSQIRYMIFESPPFRVVMRDGTINNPNFKKEIDSEKCVPFGRGLPEISAVRMFQYVYTEMMAKITENAVVNIVKQVKIPNATFKIVEAFLSERLEAVLEDGGEGLILRDPLTFWDPKRTKNLLKYVPTDKGTGTVLGYTWGDGKLMGLMGALEIQWNNKIFEIHGFTDPERQMTATDEIRRTFIPGDEVPDSIVNPRFPRGSSINFKFKGVSEYGIPKTARYDRGQMDCQE